MIDIILINPVSNGADLMSAVALSNTSPYEIPIDKP